MNLSFNDQHIPQALKATPSWICWMAKPNGERVEKIPVCATTLQHASSTDPGTWTTYEKAKHVAEKHAGLGLGFVFQRDAGIVGIDLDKCRDASTGVMEPWAHDIVRGLNSYTEVSPSGEGVHTYVSGVLPPGRRKKGRVEVYETGRFFTMTGRHLPGTPLTVEDRQPQLAEFHAEHLADPVPERPAQPMTRTATLGDVDIVDKCRKAKNAGKFDGLWRGNTAGYATHSEADLALIGLLKFYTQDTGQLDRLFRQSGLMRDKWDNGTPTYGERTIAEALAHVREIYSPHAALPRVENLTMTTTPATWPDPDPLIVRLDAVPYPVDALPDAVRCAVEEVQRFTRAPMPIVASSALSALSLAIQAHVDVQRADKLSGPVGLYLLTVADSGERKTTCDGFFTQSVRAYEAEQAEAAKPKLKDYRASFKSWEAKINGTKMKIQQLTKAGKPTTDAEQALHDIEHTEPEPPRVPRLLYADATPEALKWSLAKGWPSGGIVSSEGGLVLGSHGMNKESVMRNLSTLNQLWDGVKITTDRRSSESFTVRGARLTIGLQVQAAALRAFFDNSGGLARGTGFLARFLLAWPESTQGLRPFVEPPPAWPALETFNRRLTDILNDTVKIDEDGGLTPTMLTLSPEAKAHWIAFHDQIEEKLSPGAELCQVRDVASKIADNAARLAALLQVFCPRISKISGISFSSIDKAFLEAACRIVAWHLSEAQRFFGELSLPVELSAPALLETWIIELCTRTSKREVAVSHIQQYGPSSLRERAKLEPVLRVLNELHHIKIEKKDSRRVITVNPKLLPGGEA